MCHLNDCFHLWHCASSSRTDYLQPFSNGIPLQDINWLCLRISNTVAYRDPDNGSLAIGQEQVYLPNNPLWSKFKVPFLFNRCLDEKSRCASFDLQGLKLLMLFTGHPSMAYDKSEWKIDHWLVKSTRHSLPSPQQPSTIACWPGTQASLGSHQSLVEEAEHNVCVIQEISITWLIIHAKMNFVVLMQIFVLPR